MTDAREQERRPVRTWAELQTLDHAEIMEGYEDGFRGDPEPGDNRSKAYWHGWRNGHLDHVRGPPDQDAIALIQDMRRCGAFKLAGGWRA